MRIVFTIPGFYPQWGGAENQARRQATELARRGHQVDVVTWGRTAGGPVGLPTREKLDGVQVYRVPRRPGPIGAAAGFWAMFRTLCRVAKGADVIVAHQLLATAYLCQAAALRVHVPLVLLPVSTADFEGSDMWHLARPGLMGRLRRTLLTPTRRSGTAVALSSDIAGQLSRSGFRRIVLIPNGIPDPGLPARDALRSALHAPLGIPRDALVATAAGRFDPVKGFDVLLAAWEGVDTEAHLILVGSGPEEDALRAQAARLPRVHFARSAPQHVADWLAASDVVVLPSRYEGLSNVLLEAMIAGVPVVSSAVSGSTDFIRDGITGRLVPRANAPALAAAIVDVLESPRAMGREARILALHRCELGHVIDLYEALFARLGSLPVGVMDGEDLQGERKEELCVESAG